MAKSSAKRYERCYNDFVIKNIPKMVFYICYHLPCNFKIFINVFAFLYVRANSKEISEEMSFLFFQKNDDVSIFIEIQG